MQRRTRWLLIALLAAAGVVVAAGPKIRGGLRYVRAALTAPDPAEEAGPERLAVGRRAVAEAIRRSDESGGFAIVVEKSTYTLWVYEDGLEIMRWPVELGADPVSRKLREGDMSTPEGLYRITWRRDKGETDFYRAFLLDYPNADDRTAGRTGSFIEIHGSGTGKRPGDGGRNWTWGCVSLSNEHIDALFAATAGERRIGKGTPVAIAWLLADTNE